jgi:formate-dependent nitrite reductase membrane component NrfD
MSDTFFTTSPHWAWYIIGYFFVGGMAGGAFVIAGLLQLFGRPEDRRVIRHGYDVAFAGAVVSGMLLTIDLTRPLRFWHMLIQSNTGAPMFKPWSPMSVGAWGLLVFGLFAALAVLGTAAREERWRARPLAWPPVRALGAGLPARIVAVSGLLSGFFLAGYTGVLLAVTNRPIWADSQWLGLVFLVSGISTGAATLILLSLWRGDAHPGTLAWLARFDRQTLVLELITLIVFVVSLGSVARVLVGWWGLVMLVGVVGAGILLPLLLGHGESPSLSRLARPATLVLLGGLLLRISIVLSSEQISHLAGAGIGTP